jgi:hypothetical protein
LFPNKALGVTAIHAYFVDKGHDIPEGEPRQTVFFSKPIS